MLCLLPATMLFADSFYTVSELMNIYNNLSLEDGTTSSDSYTVRGYVTKWKSGYPDWQNGDFFIDDNANGSTSLLECFRLTAPNTDDQRTLINGDYVEGDALEPFIKDALDEIEYTIGGPETRWGARRIRDGHPEPFKLTYVEIGNEDFFDRSGSYSHRFMRFYDAIKEKYPQLQIISTQDERTLRGNAENPAAIKVDVIDEHYYRNAEAMYRAAQQYDSYDRNGPKIFCGEWATREGSPTTNMNAALGDAAWMTCMERNSDILVAHCYAPLFVNVNQGGMQWESDLIGYDALTSFGSPSYHAQCMFAQNLGNKVVPMEAEGVPTTPMGREPVPQLYYNTTVDSQTGKLYLKLVNIGASSQTVNVVTTGAKVKGKAVVTTLKSARPEDTNSIDNPNNIVPAKSSLKVSNNFKIALAPYSISVVVM